MTNRKLAYIIKDQRPLVVNSSETIARSCRLMLECRAGSVLIVDAQDYLSGIFTGRDAVRFLAEGKDTTTTPLSKAMTLNPMTLPPSCRAIDAMKKMIDGRFRHLPVVENGRIFGVVSRGDFKGMEFEEFSWEGLYKQTGITANRSVEDIIEAREPLVFSAADPVQRACQSMLDSGSGIVLVTDAGNRLIGVFTGHDAVRLLAAERDASRTTLGQAMKADPVTVGPDCQAIDALRIMSDGGFRHVPVVENGRICGIVERSDFTAIELDRLDEEEHLAECIW